MTIDEVLRLSFFARLSRMRVAEGLSSFTHCMIGPREVLMHEGEIDRSMLLILEGELVICVGERMVEVGRVGAGDTVGSLTLFGSLDRRSATVMTWTECRLLVLDMDGVRHLRLKSNPMLPPLQDHAARMAVARMRDTHRLIGSVTPGSELPAPPRPGLLARIFSNTGPDTPQPNVLAVMQRSRTFVGEKLGLLARLLSEQGQLMGLGPGARVALHGEEGCGPVLLLQGQVDVWHPARAGGHIRMSRLSEGSLFCLGPEVDGEPVSASYLCASPCWVLMLPVSIGEGLTQAGGALPTLWQHAVFNSLGDGIRQANAAVEVHQQRLELLSLKP